MADFNCDGTLDIAAASSGCEQATQGCTNGVDQPPALWLLPGHGNGFDARIDIDVPAYCDNIVVADFNGDGYTDLACGSGGNSINVLLNQH